MNDHKCKVYFRNDKTTDTWLTPLHLVRALGDFDLDPCGYPGHPTARKLFTLPDTDGFAAGWHGRVWLNPPYGGECGAWVDKLADHGTGTALVFARIETAWFQRALKRATAVLFPAGRISFIRADGSKAGAASAPSALLAFGENDAIDLEFSGVDGWFVRLKGVDA